MYYHLQIGWQASGMVYTSLESALQEFIERQNRCCDKNIKYYQPIEVELEIPFIPKED